METITKSCVLIQAPVQTKEEAIRLAGRLLVDAGYIAPPYVDSLMQREAVSNTFLGAGVAIPHGMIEDRHHVLHTGIAVLQVPGGIPWQEGKEARLIVAIAAQSDEHIAILRRLTRLMQQAGAIDELATCTDPGRIVAALTDTPYVPPAAAAPWPADARLELVLDYPNGLHARPATRWVETARRHAGVLRVFKDGEHADAKSLSELLSLGITRGQKLVLAARGENAGNAVRDLAETITRLSAEEIGDAERARAAAERARADAPAWKPDAAGRQQQGVAASPGLAVGRIARHQSSALAVTDASAGAVAEGTALEAALARVAAELGELAGETRRRLGAGEAAIFAAQRELISDPVLMRAAYGEIMRGHGAAWAWKKALDARVDRQRRLPDPLLAARALDLKDAGERVLAALLGVERRAMVLREPTILVAEDLTPSDTLQLDMRHVVGLAISGGGPTSHTAILARTLGLPALVAAGPSLLAVDDGAEAVIDGTAGCLYLDCTAADLDSARAAIAAQAERSAAMRADRHQPAVTADGHAVGIFANVANARQAADAVAAGAEGVGLMRTEFLFLERDSAPGEDEQYAAYRDTLAALAGRPLIIRTLDIGGDKQVPYLDLPREENPFLGVRGARLLLARPELLRTQLRALYRAAAHGSQPGALSIMFPMVTRIAEVTALRAECEQVRAALGAPKVPLGIMVEVPAVAVMAERFAREVNFFSIGTNDLTQYVLAMDRQHPQLAAQADPLDPAVLALIGATAAAAGKAGIHVGVCGGLAGDPLGARILTGLGVSELSMSAQDIAAVKTVLRAETFSNLQQLAQRALAARDAAEVRAL
ncbi:phosphoenolpyruvate--protein phosphotransferase [Propionivibrio sp.]|uniref:phosphoenolpyruvate--protein phosphotransferase n=1 Tax=Propionivibrio sp. TaxID=2212460 RepID=UPI0039E5D6F4